ncbi:hypothetical protein ACI3PL_31960, partial [Lacticaseibacillus paracasei]
SGLEPKGLGLWPFWFKVLTSRFLRLFARFGEQQWTTSIIKKSSPHKPNFYNNPSSHPKFQQHKQISIILKPKLFS